MRHVGVGNSIVKQEKRIMNAKAYDKKTAAFAGYLIQNVPGLDHQTMQLWMEDPRALIKLLAQLEQGPPLFSHGLTVTLDSVPITTLLLKRSATLMEIAASLLGLSVRTEREMQASLRRKGHTLTPNQVSDLISRSNRGEYIGINCEGEENLYFIWGSPMPVGSIARRDREWRWTYKSLGSQKVWFRDTQLIVPNFDLSRL